MLLVCEPGMKARHWEEIKATTKLDFSVTSGMNMMQLMDIGRRPASKFKSRFNLRCGSLHAIACSRGIARRDQFHAG